MLRGYGPAKHCHTRLNKRASVLVLRCYAVSFSWLVWFGFTGHVWAEAKTIRVAATRNEEKKHHLELQKEAPIDFVGFGESPGTW